MEQDANDHLDRALSLLNGADASGSELAGTGTFDLPRVNSLGGPKGITSKAFARGKGGLEQSVGGAEEFVGNLLGIQSLVQRGRADQATGSLIAQRNPESVSFQQVKDSPTLGNIATFAYEKVLEQAPNFALLATGAGAGSVAARIAFGAAKEVATGAGAAAKFFANPSAIGASVGSAAVDFPQQLGEAVQAVKAGGGKLDDNTASVLLAGIVNTTLDIGSIGFIFKNAAKDISEAAAKEMVKANIEKLKSQGLFKSLGAITAKAGVASLKGLAVEGSTEVLQDITNNTVRAANDPSFDMFSQDAMNGYIETFISAGLPGAALAGGGRGIGAAVERVRASNALPDTTPETDPTTVDPTKTPSSETLDQATADVVDVMSGATDQVVDPLAVNNVDVQPPTTESSQAQAQAQPAQPAQPAQAQAQTQPAQAQAQTQPAQTRAEVEQAQIDRTNAAFGNPTSAAPEGPTHVFNNADEAVNALNQQAANLQQEHPNARLTKGVEDSIQNLPKVFDSRTKPIPNLKVIDGDRIVFDTKPENALGLTPAGAQKAGVAPQQAPAKAPAAATKSAKPSTPPGQAALQRAAERDSQAFHKATGAIPEATRTAEKAQAAADQRVPKAAKANIAAQRKKLASQKGKVTKQRLVAERKLQTMTKPGQKKRPAGNVDAVRNDISRLKGAEQHLAQRIEQLDKAAASTDLNVLRKFAQGDAELGRLTRAAKSAQTLLNKARGTATQARARLSHNLGLVAQSLKKQGKVGRAETVNFLINQIAANGDADILPSIDARQSVRALPKGMRLKVTRALFDNETLSLIAVTSRVPVATLARIARDVELTPEQKAAAIIYAQNGKTTSEALRLAKETPVDFARVQVFGARVVSLTDKRAAVPLAQVRKIAASIGLAKDLFKNGHRPTIDEVFTLASTLADGDPAKTVTEMAKLQIAVNLLEQGVITDHVIQDMAAQLDARSMVAQTNLEEDERDLQMMDSVGPEARQPIIFTAEPPQVDTEANPSTLEAQNSRRRRVIRDVVQFLSMAKAITTAGVAEVKVYVVSLGRSSDAERANLATVDPRDLPDTQGNFLSDNTGPTATLVDDNFDTSVLLKKDVFVKVVIGPTENASVDISFAERGQGQLLARLFRAINAGRRVASDLGSSDVSRNSVMFYLDDTTKPLDSADVSQQFFPDDEKLIQEQFGRRGSYPAVIKIRIREALEMGMQLANIGSKAVSQLTAAEKAQAYAAFESWMLSLDQAPWRILPQGKSFAAVNKAFRTRKTLPSRGSPKEAKLGVDISVLSPEEAKSYLALVDEALVGPLDEGKIADIVERFDLDRSRGEGKAKSKKVVLTSLTDEQLDVALVELNAAYEHSKQVLKVLREKAKVSLEDAQQAVQAIQNNIDEQRNAVEVLVQEKADIVAQLAKPQKRLTAAQSQKVKDLKARLLRLREVIPQQEKKLDQLETEAANLRISSVGGRRNLVPSDPNHIGQIVAYMKELSGLDVSPELRDLIFQERATAGQALSLAVVREEVRQRLSGDFTGDYVPADWFNAALSDDADAATRLNNAALEQERANAPDDRTLDPQLTDLPRTAGEHRNTVYQALGVTKPLPPPSAQVSRPVASFDARVARDTNPEKPTVRTRILNRAHAVMKKLKLDNVSWSMGVGLDAARTALVRANTALLDNALSRKIAKNMPDLETVKAAAAHIEDARDLLESAGYSPKEANTIVEGMRSNEAQFGAVRASSKPGISILYRVAYDGQFSYAPYVHISGNVKENTRLNTVLMHEMGHVVAHYALARADEATRKALFDAFGGGEQSNTRFFQENFAQMFSVWASDPARVKRETLDTVVNGVIAMQTGEVVDPKHPNQGDARIAAIATRLRDRLRKFLNNLKKAFQALYKEFVSDQPKGVETYATFTQFIDAWIGDTPRAKTGVSKGSSTNPLIRGLDRSPIYGLRKANVIPADFVDNVSYDYTSDSAIKNTPAPWRQNWKKLSALFSRKAKQAGNVSEKIWDHSARGYDSVLRHMPGKIATFLADSFAPPPGSSGTSGGGKLGTIQVEQRARHQSFYAEQIAPLLKGHYQPRGLFHKATVSDAFQSATDEVLQGIAKSPLAKEIVRVVRLLDAEREKLNLPPMFNDKLIPVAYDAIKLAKNKDRFMEKFRTWSKTKEAELWWSKHQPELPLTESNWESLAHTMHEAMTRHEFVLEHIEFAEQLSEGGRKAVDALMPWALTRSTNTIPNGLFVELQEFRERDIAKLLDSASRSTAKRIAWHRRHGLHKPLAEVGKLFKEAKQMALASRNLNNASPEDRKLINAARKAVGVRPTRDQVEHAFFKAKDRQTELKKFFKEKFNVDLYSPTAALEIAIADEASRPEANTLSPKDADRILKDILPAYQGRLGADMMPFWRRLQTGAVIYTSLRLLNLSVLSQFVDPALLFHRAMPGTRWKMMGTAVHLAMSRIFDKQKFKGIKDLAMRLGVVDQLITDHALNDMREAFFDTGKLQLLGNHMFRWNGMHATTNFWRTVGTAYTLEMFDVAAKEGDTTFLDQFGLSREEVTAWVNAGRPTNWVPEFAKVIGAIHQINDESILRSSPAHRPYVGNNQKVGVLWNLKSFTFSFGNVVLPRVYQETIKKYGQEEGARRFYAALPFLSLALFTMPMAAMGMEIRWWLVPNKNKPERGGWQWYYDAANRAGIFGQAQVLLDSMTSLSYRKSPNGVLFGPSVDLLGKFSDALFSGNYDRFLERAAPGRDFFVAGSTIINAVGF